MNDILNRTIDAFNERRFGEACNLSAEGLSTAQGQDEVFWMGLLDACEGYEFIVADQLLKAERMLIASMQKLRNFGFRYDNFEVTTALAAIRRSVEEIRIVRQGGRRIFDVSILPQLRLAAKADD